MTTQVSAPMIASLPAGSVTTATILDGSVTAAKMDTGSAQALMPPGAVVPFAATTAPTGWLLCYGQAVSRTTYAALFAVIGTTYGAGDGSTTFAVPDLRGRIPAGKDNMGGSSANRLTLISNNIGSAGGAESVVLSTGEIPAHSHTFSYDTASGSNTASNRVITTSGTNGAGANATSSSVGGGGAHNNVQPSIVLAYIIKT